VKKCAGNIYAMFAVTKNQLAIIILAAVVGAESTQAAEKASEQRQEKVAQRGAGVMPFDLEKTTPIFSITQAGGVQQVVVRDASDLNQLGLCGSIC
jgi:hypothetical protein